MDLRQYSAESAREESRVIKLASDWLHAELLDAQSRCDLCGGSLFSDRVESIELDGDTGSYVVNFELHCAGCAGHDGHVSLEVHTRG